MDLPTTVAGSAVLDSVGMAGLATASEVEDFTVAVTGNPSQAIRPDEGSIISRGSIGLRRRKSGG
jgi:hypothetical protein